MENPRLFTLQDFCHRNPGFNLGYLRWLKYRSGPVTRIRGGVRESLAPNGFAKAFIRIGGRIFIDERCFFQIVARQNRRGDR